MALRFRAMLSRGAKEKRLPTRSEALAQLRNLSRLLNGPSAVSDGHPAGHLAAAIL